MWIRTAPPGRSIYIAQCRYFLFEKLGAVVFWEKDIDIPGGLPHIQFWVRRPAKCFVHPPQLASIPVLHEWMDYNSRKGRHRMLRLYRGRGYIHA